MGKYKICQKYIISLACLLSQRLCGSHQRLIWRIISDSWMQLSFPTEKTISFCLIRNSLARKEKQQNWTKENPKSLWTAALPFNTNKQNVSYRNIDKP